jgi:predicted Zn finger-like uncharacterized protein
MSGGLATRCPSCGTVFRVVTDQLRVSEGWVRCGRCAEVFNASEQLIDLGSSSPPPLEPQAQEEAEPPTHGVPPVEEPPAPAPDPADPPIDFELELEPGTADPRAQAPADQPDLPDPHDLLEAPDAAAPPDAGSPSVQTAATTPSFVRRAERAERWRQSRVRRALAGAAALGLMLLVGQLLTVYRDLAAAHFAVLRAPLEAACEPLGCTVGAAHAIESLAVESSGLVRVEKSNVYKLSVAVRNRAAIDLAVPALDLTLTDVQGKLLARRVLRAAELGIATGVVAAGTDLAFQATLQATTEPIAGYTIDLFYP